MKITTQKLLDNYNLSNYDDSFELARNCSSFLESPNSESQGRDLVIRVLNSWAKIHPMTKILWNELTVAAGLHPYTIDELLTGSSTIRHEFCKSNILNNIYFHEEQMYISLLLKSKKSIVVSAPTSFGKSLLIEEIVARKQFKNIVIIQPTLALLDETRKKLQKYDDTYNIVVSTTQPALEENNLFLFTGERVVEYEKFPKIDFFVIDEFYKLSSDRDDERAPILNLALYRLLKMTKNFYMLGPNIKEIPQEFKDKHELIWFETDFATVAVNVHEVNGGNIKHSEEKISILFKLLKKIKQPTLIYCSSPDKAGNLALKFADFISKEKKITSSNPNYEMIEWINENIHEEWGLKKALAVSVGAHHGSLPRHLASSIVDAFNKHNIKYLFCTSTLIEGVNTTAKNVILYDKTKGRKPIDYFDFKNIVGRSGRMKMHFIGSVYQFHPEPKQKDVIVDIPIITQENASIELLVQVDKMDLKNTSDKKLQDFNSLEPAIQQLIRKNIGIPISGQLKIIDVLNKEFKVYYPDIFWTGIPKYHQLEKVLELAWNYLLTSGQKGGAFSPKQLAFYTLNYSRKKSINALIKETINSGYYFQNVEHDVRVQKIIHMILQITRNWFDYRLPKYLNVLSEIQAYVCKAKGLEPGNYSYFASLLESNFLPSNLAILTEYDIPASAIMKLKNLITNDLTTQEIFNVLSKVNLSNYGLLPYEIQKIEILIRRLT